MDRSFRPTVYLTKSRPSQGEMGFDDPVARTNSANTVA